MFPKLHLGPILNTAQNHTPNPGLDQNNPTGFITGSSYPLTHIVDVIQLLTIGRHCTCSRTSRFLSWCKPGSPKAIPYNSLASHSHFSGCGRGAGPVDSKTLQHLPSSQESHRKAHRTTQNCIKNCVKQQNSVYSRPA